MNIIKDYHHYKKELVDKNDRVSRCEIYVMELILNSNLKESERESSKIFELKHHHSTAQLARILARKRNLPIDICTIGALIHDIYVIKTGKYKNHAHAGAEMVNDILDNIGNFTDEERKQIYKIVYNHSDKDTWSKDPFEELGKDADVLDCFLYPDCFEYYLKNKPLKIGYQYIIRAKKIWDELNIPQDKEFSVLDNYNENWLDLNFEVDEQKLVEILNNKTAPTFCFYKKDNKYQIYTNKINWNNIDNKNKKNKNIDNLLKLANKSDNIILVWSAIDSYEVLSKINSKNRLKELGVNELC